MERVTKERLFPLTSQQLSYWNAGTSSETFYCGALSVTAYRLVGDLDLESLIRSFHLIVQRHDAVRLRLSVKDGVPLQRIASPDGFEVQVIDLTNDGNARESAKGIVEELSTRHENMVEKSLFQVTILNISSVENILAIRADHIAADRWSADILYSELALFYRYLSRRESPERLSQPVQFSEYIDWQEKWFSSEQAKRHIDYVRDAVAATRVIAPSGALELSAQNPCRVPIVELSEQQQGVLNRYAASNGIKLSFLVTAIYSYALSRWSGLEELVIYSVFNGRREPEFLKTVGCLAHSVLFRIRLFTGIELTDALKVVSKAIINGYMHHGAMDQALPEKPCCLFGYLGREEVGLALDGVTIGALDRIIHPHWRNNGKLNIVTSLAMIHRNENLSIHLYSGLLSAEVLEPLARCIRELIGGIVTESSVPPVSACQSVTQAQ